MKYFFALVLVLTATYAAWPYVYLYRIDNALAANDLGTLDKLVDLDAVRAEVKRSLDQDVDDALGEEPGAVLGWVKDKLNDLSDRAVEEIVDHAWVRRTLAPDEGSFVGSVSYAFFESWDTFLIRRGELGEDPIHLRMSLSHGNWRVTAIYD